MENELINIVCNGKSRMEVYINRIKNKLSKVNFCKANPSMIEDIKIEYSGIQLSLKDIATINVIDARTLSIQPWEPKMLLSIYKTIIKNNTDLHYVNNGNNIIIKIPPITEERRTKLVKEVKYEYEKSKIYVRNIRKYINKKIYQIKIVDEDLLNKYEKKIQEITDLYLKELEKIYYYKIKDISII
jgi:ribosome recycling factor